MGGDTEDVLKALSRQGKLVLDDARYVLKVEDRGESFRLENEEQTHLNPGSNGATNGYGGPRPGSDVIDRIAAELDEAKVPYLLDPEKEFIPRRKFEQIMSLDRIRQVIFQLRCFNERRDKDQLAREIRYGSLDGSRPPCVKLLAVLIGIEKAEDMAKLMLHDGVSDACLPLHRAPTDTCQALLCCRKHKNDHRQLNSYSRPDVRKRFAQWSYALCSMFIKWQPNKHSHYILDTGDVFPMEVVDKVKEDTKTSSTAKGGSGSNEDAYGGFSEVYKVKIQDGHSDFGSHGIRHPQGYFALKKLTSHSRDSFNLELSSLVSTGRNYDKKHIIQLLATFEVRNTATNVSTFHLLFDWADGTLGKFWQANQSLVRDKTHCLWMATQFYEICEALQSVHNDREPTTRYLEDRDSNQELYGRHGDIKPGNFLWFQTTTYPGLLALADFGLGRLHTQVSRSKQDPNSLERTATYRCPEFDLQFGLVSSRSDIFSLGCVFLEYVTWFCLGLNAVEKDFPESRLEHDIHGFDSDVFFSIKDRKAYLKPAVAAWIQTLQGRPDCSWYLWDLLEVIRDGMLDPDSKTRMPASQLTKRMKDLMSVCKVESDYYLGTKTHD